jgi:hypothetical protein
MSLIVRIDVDRPYGKHPLHRHLLSRLSSDTPFPRCGGLGFGYLEELSRILKMLNSYRAKAFAFFRRCTLPTPEVMRLLLEGEHEIGLHLENSRSFETFSREKELLEHSVNRPVTSFSKHGSGGRRFGFHHHAPYEPEKYVEWARKAGMKVFLGNGEDPTTLPAKDERGLTFFPSAFWLEPYWRDTKKYTIDWLLEQARHSDVVMLIHPENVLESAKLTSDFERLISSLPTTNLS